jgi:hypothetical protein
MNPHLTQAIADRRDVAGVALLESLDPRDDFRAGTYIAELLQPG